LPGPESAKGWLDTRACSSRLAIQSAVRPGWFRVALLLAIQEDLPMTDENDTPETETEDNFAQVPDGRRMSLQELKEKSPADLLQLAESLDIENAASLRKQGMMFAILKALAEQGAEIHGGGTLEVLQDGFGFLRSPEANYLAGPDDIYVSPNQIRKFGLRNGDTVEGEIRAPRDGSAISRF